MRTTGTGWFLMGLALFASASCRATGVPSGVSASPPAAGAVPVEVVGGMAAGGIGPQWVFVIRPDGNLWANGWDGKGWTWVNHGKPPGVGKIEGRGVTISGGRPYVFVNEINVPNQRLWLRTIDPADPTWKT